MAATESPPSTASSTSFASRRPQARAALPPFTLPPPPEFPRAAAADTLSPPTPASASGSAPRQPSPSPSYSASSSPGYSTGTTLLAHPQRAASLSPYEPHHRPQSSGAPTQPRLAPRPGPLSHPHGPNTSTSPPPRRPLPGSPAQLSPPRSTQRLPPISSLIPPHEHRGLAAPGLPGPAPPPGQGYLAMPMVKPWPSQSGQPRPLQTPWNFPMPPQPPMPLPPRQDVQEVPLSMSQDRPFRCDLCTQRFSRNHDLKRHKRIHMAAKPFPCTTCHKTFSRSDALKRHRLVKACQQKDEDEARAASSAGVKSPGLPAKTERGLVEPELPPTNFPLKTREQPVDPSPEPKLPSPDS